jgi:hypothetical protein
MQTEITLLLDKIKSEDMISVWPYLFQVTDTWMSAGYFNEANRLLSVFFEAKNEVAPQFYIDTYEIPWALTGTRPHNVPALTRSIDDIELGLWDNLFGPNGYWGWRMLSDCGEALSVFIDRIKTTELEKLAGNDLRVRAAMIAYDKDRLGHVASSEFLFEASLLLERFLEPRAPLPSNLDLSGYVPVYHAVSAQAILASRLGDVDRATAHLVAISKNGIGLLLRDGMVAKIALSGVLGANWEITPQQCDEDAQLIEKALRERFKSGRQLAYGRLTWRQLLRRLHRVWEVGPNREPATTTAIKTAEKRLGIRLPASYRAFLAVTNGLAKYNPVGVEIFPIEKIAWLREVEQELFDAYSDPELEDISCKLRKSLLIGSEPLGTERLLLVPVDDPAAEWECWFFAHWGQELHQTFRHFIGSELQRSDLLVGVAHLAKFGNVDC